MPAEIRIVISNSSSGSALADTTKGIENLGETAEKSGSGFSAMREVATGAMRAIGEAITGFALDGLKSLAGAVSDGIADARENAKIQAQTAQVIKSTGNAAGVTAEQVADYASSLSAAAGQSLFGDDQIQQSENLLLTFSNIHDTVLEAATAISVDMAQALGGAPKDSAIQLGKALNDPIKGITALTRVGVTFTDEQKQQIKTLQESGDIQGAQTVILEELNKEFGGSAAAAAQADGGWAQFNDRMGEVKESIGTAILPLLGMLAGVLNDTIAPAVESAAATFSAWLSDPTVVAEIQAIGQAITTGIGAAFIFLTQTIIPALISAWNTVLPVIQSVGAAFTEASGATGLFQTAIAAIQGAFSGLVATFTDSRTPIEGFLNVLSEISPTFALARAAIEAALPPIQEIILSVFGIIQGFIQEHGEKIRSDITGAWQQIQAIINEITPLIQEIITAVFGNIALFLQTHGEEIKAFMAQTWDGIAQIVNLALQLIQAIAGFITSHGTEIQAILNTTWEAIKLIINTAITLIRGILTAALQAIHGDWAGAWNTIKTMSAQVVQNLIDLFRLGFEQIKIVILTIWNGIKGDLEQILNGIVGFVIQTMIGIANSIRNFGSQAAGAAASVGGAIVSGIADGIRNGADAIISAAKNAAMAALHAAESALGISSPSKVFAEGVGLPMAQGMAQGFISGTPLVTQAADMVSGAAVATAASRTTNHNNQRNINATFNMHSVSDVSGASSAILQSLAGV